MRTPQMPRPNHLHHKTTALRQIMKTTKKLTAAIISCALIPLIITAGCTTAAKGTTRHTRMISDIPGTQVSLNGGPPQPASQPFTLKTYQHGPFVFTAVTPDGRVQEQTVVWKIKDGKYFLVAGGVGWGVVTGVGGLVDLLIDYGTKAYRDPDREVVSFKFADQLRVAPTYYSPPVYTAPAPTPSPVEQPTTFPTLVPAAPRTANDCPTGDRY